MSEHDCLGDHFKEQIKALEAERDKLKAEVKKLMTGEHMCIAVLDRDLWKRKAETYESKANKLAEALDGMLGYQSLATKKVVDEARATLALFEREEGE